jgi:L-amino acid N-acyltransferase
MQIRNAEIADLPGLLTIYNDVIATSTAVYTDMAATLEDREAWLRARQGQGFPVLVAVDGGTIAGFSSFGEFRGSWPGYLHSVEHSVHVHRDWRGKGVGHALVEALFPLAAAMDKHVMIGAIDAANAGSIRFHERLGFSTVGHMREVGRKFGRWLDLVFMQRFLDAPGAPRRD